MKSPRINRTLLSLLILLTSSGSLIAGNVLDKTGNPTATPLVAFSVRLLSSAYTGKCINVRRSSDGASQDIGFTPAGDLDTTMLKTFVGSGTGYVTTWYDQSGNGYNAIQGTAANQPTIMISGVICRDNGQPSVYTSAAGFLTYGAVSQLSGTTQVTRTEVCRSRDGNDLAITEGLGTYQLDLQFFPTKIWVQFETGNIVANAAVSPPTTLMSINSVRNNGACQVYVNTTLQGTATAAIMSLSAPVTGYIGVRFDYQLSNTGEPGAFSETILFNSVLSDADRQSINYNENWYYSLGFDVCSSTQAALSPNGATDNALYACTQDVGYTYYYDPAHPLNLLFGIAQDPNGTGANPSFVADSIGLTVTPDPSTTCYSATSGMEGIFALGRYWNVYTHTPLTSPVNVRFFYKPSDTIEALDAAQTFKTSSGASTISSLQWFKTVGAPFSPDSLTAIPTATVKGQTLILTPIYGTKNGINYAEFDGVPGFSGGTGVYIVANSLITLPTVIEAFTAKRVAETTALAWTTGSESNTDHFDIQRSTKGYTWLTIGQVAAAGNSSNPLSYRYTDTVSLQAGNNLYYRVQLINKDGGTIYSTVALVTANTNTAKTLDLTGIVPNPFRNQMELTCTVPGAGPVDILLRDITGATLLHQTYMATKGENILTLSNLDGLPPGMYIVRVLQEGTGTAGIAKVIKE